MARPREVWEIELPEVHRALLALCRERLTKAEQPALDGMGEAQLAAMLRDFLREEYISIPVGTPVIKCRSCEARVCWVPFDHKQYRSSFVVNGSKCIAPTAARQGYGYHHLADCPASGLVQMANARYADTDLPRAVEEQPDLLPAAPRQAQVA